MTPSATVAWRQRSGVLVAACAAAYLPFVLLGYGTDIDVANVLRAGRSWLDDGDYELSRGPGAAIHELATAALDRVGGSVLVNLASLAFAALALWAVHVLVVHDGGAPRRAVLVLASNPWFWIAATSLGDFVWALALVLAGSVAAQRDRRLAAGILFGLAIGCRASTALLVAAWLLAEQLGTRRRIAPQATEPSMTRRVESAMASAASAPTSALYEDSGGGATIASGPTPAAVGRAQSPGPAIVTAAVAAAIGVLCFVPPWLDAGRSLSFIDNELTFAGAGVHLGRWAVKNVAVLGVLGGAVYLIGMRRLTDAVRRWSTSSVVRFAVLAIVVSELLFLRFPFKPMHLLPVVAGLALLVGLSPTVSRRWVGALVVAQLVGGLIGTTLAAPDVQDAAHSGRLDLGITEGPLLTDVQCRLDDRDLGPWPAADTLAAIERAGANAACQSQTWRADP